MKKTTTILFSILIHLVFWGTAIGQTTVFTDDFETGNLSLWTDIESHWDASVTNPINGTYSLKHNLSSVEGTSYISTSISADDINSKVTTWQFNIQNGSWDPSGGNFFGIAILGDEADPQSVTFNGYVLGINFTSTSDFLTLYKVINGTYSSIITTDFDWDSGNLIGIRIERNTTGIWQLHYDSDGGFDNLTLGGSTADNDHTTFSNISVYFEYTSTRAGELWVDDILLEQEDETIKAEPSDHVTDFNSTGSIKSVSLSWSDISSSPTPDGYLIKASNVGFGSITAPTDSNTESDDTDLSDGSATVNVLQGIEQVSFMGLEETTTYYFKIYPYTNVGSDIDYKTDGTIPQQSATTPEIPIVLNEFLADPNSSTGDANGDGVVSSDDDEFVEFVNISNSVLDISEWEIEDGTSSRHTFPSGTILDPQQAIVVFGGDTPTGDFGGAIVQTTSTLSFANGGDNIILKDNNGVVIINLSYGSAGLEADNDQSLTRNPDLTGNFTAHSSADPGGSDFSPGTRVDGFAFIPRIEITGNEGWRMLSSPTSNNSYDDLLGTIWTQGSTTGANHPGGDPNVLTYDGSAFIAVDDLTSTMNEGDGFLVFIYSDDDYTDSGTDNGFPKVLEMSGTENTGTVSPSINEGASNTATLVGNPYLSPIDWDELTKENLTNTVYVYDDSYGTPSGDDVEASGVAGSYRVWNGSSGSLDQGRIAPFQGFFVLYDGSGTASLTIDESDKTVGGMFFKHQPDEAIAIRLKAETGTMFNETFFSFNEGGQLELDHFDGLELTPLDHGDYLSLATVTEGTLLDINNLPVELGEPVDIPLHVQTFEAIESGWIPKGGEITLSWPAIQNIPAEWSLILADEQTRKEINLKETDSYTFILDETATKNVDKKPFHPFLNNSIQQEKAVQDNRFILSIDPGFENSKVSDLPEQFVLNQNYPNPFNPTTNIKYEIADLTDVELSVYNVMGQRITTLVNETKAPGSYEITWDASEMASGIYYYQLNVSGVVFTRQMTLIK